MKKIQIDIFDNRVEISNPGGLIISNPGGLVKWLRPEDFGKYSRARNQIIADILSRTIYVEKVGSGINRIKEAMSKSGLPEPIFEYNSSFATTLLDETFVKGKVTEKVTENQRLILEAIEKNPNVSSIELSKLIGISDRKIKENLRKLKEKGFIRRIGPDRGGYWKVIKARENKKK